jgi:hypothetical protein
MIRDCDALVRLSATFADDVGIDALFDKGIKNE